MEICGLHVLIGFLCLVSCTWSYQVTLSEDGCKRVQWSSSEDTQQSASQLQKKHSEDEVIEMAAASGASPVGPLRDQVCARICSFWSCTTYFCKGDSICCTPGSPSSTCCPADKPLCIYPMSCCPVGYPQVCGRYCCMNNNFCCQDKTCCRNEKSCCTDKCCVDQNPCCSTKPNAKTCCDKDKMACCDVDGCVAPCQSIFEAVGCYLLFNNQASFTALPAGPNIPCPDKTTTLYRILRPEEDCNLGLVPKNPTSLATVLSHVNCGSRPTYKGSRFISFTSSLEVARYYKAKFAADRIAEVTNIPSTCDVIDLTIAEVRNQYLGKAVCGNFAKASCEVLLQCTEPVKCKLVE